MCEEVANVIEESIFYREGRNFYGYMCTDRASYHAEAAKDSWEKMVGFFGKHLK